MTVPARRYPAPLYDYLGQMVILLMASVAVTLVAATYRLPGRPFPDLAPFDRVASLVALLFRLALLSGLLGGGHYVATTSRDTGFNERLLRIIGRLWLGVLVWAGIAGIAGHLGPAPRELPALLNALHVLVIGLVVWQLASHGSRSPELMVWTTGMVAYLIAALVALIPTPDIARETILNVVANGLGWMIGLPVAALAVAYGLMRRFSNAPTDWLQESLLIVAPMFALAGVLLTVSSLYPITHGTRIAAAGNLAALTVPLLMLIVAGHSYRALRDRANNGTLAAHWVALAVLFLGIGYAVLGSLLAPPAVASWTLATRLIEARDWFIALVPLAVLLGLINQVAADLHGVNGRITGYIPFWLLGFGAIMAGIFLAAGGIGQVYMERVLGVPFGTAERLLAPLDALRVLAVLLAAGGVGIYALSFWRRRPPDTPDTVE